MDSTLRELFDRYGPTAAVIVTIMLLVVLLPGNASRSGSNSADTLPVPVGPQTGIPTPGDDVPAGVGSSAGSGTGVIPGGSGSVASGGGSRSVITIGKVYKDPWTGRPACRKTGQQQGYSVWAPPCIGFTGKNDGATARGVTATSVKVAMYVPQANAATAAALQAAGATDSQEVIDRNVEVMRRFFNTHYQTYGREVTFTKVNASGATNDDVAARADAAAIATAGYFAVFTTAGETGNKTFDKELARRGVLCLKCSYTEGDSFYRSTKGLNFSYSPTLRQFYRNIAEYWGKRLVGQGRVAKWAGAPASLRTDLRKLPRKFGLIWMNATAGVVNPSRQEERDYFVKVLLPKYGIRNVVDASYNGDVSTGPSQAQTIIARMNAENVTTITIVGDNLLPIFFTREATKQQYKPEWFHAGTYLSDLTALGRLYDQDQWGRSFGISPNYPFWIHNKYSFGYQEYHNMCPTAAPSACKPGDEGTTINLNRTAVELVFVGIHMAGQHLTPQTFAQGFYNYPSTGPSPFPKYYMTPDQPVWLHDFTQVWWYRDGTGMDEINRDGQGTLLKMENGRRYQLGKWPTTEPPAFDLRNTVFTTNEPYLAQLKLWSEPPGLHPASEKCMSCPR